MLTARKRVHPFPARIPATRRRFRYVSSSSSPRKRRRVSPYLSSSVSLSPSSSVEPSCTRGRPPTADLSPIQADLLPPRKRLRGSPSTFHQETSIEDSTERGYEARIKGHTEIGLETDIKAGVKVGTEVGVNASVGAIVEIAIDVMAEPDTLPVLPEQTVAERLDDYEEVIQEIIMSATRSGMTPEAIEEVIAQRVAEALETYEAN
ncbi:hypothetical protein Tco_0937436 [Tanacetum coccineum]|uniref:Uncharacterized protein n=1 Tax=Tanacetum coccineum TaxID=301880 RepID=A0ABQ5DE88_9ASTR